MKAALLVIGLLCVLAFAPRTNAFEQSGQATPTQEPPIFRRTVDMVLIDVIVTDKKGRAVPGLMQSDFVITEDGRRQSIEAFEEFQTTDVAGEINFSGASATSPTAGRFFTIVVDDIHITPHPPAILRARAAAAADGKFRKIKVKVNRKGLKVRARKGYFAPFEEEPPSK